MSAFYFLQVFVWLDACYAIHCISCSSTGYSIMKEDIWDTNQQFHYLNEITQILFLDICQKYKHTMLYIFRCVEGENIYVGHPNFKWHIGLATIRGIYHVTFELNVNLVHIKPLCSSNLIFYQISVCQPVWITAIGFEREAPKQQKRVKMQKNVGKKFFGWNSFWRPTLSELENSWEQVWTQS